MARWYADSVKYAAVAAWAASTSYPSGSLVRQLATPTVGNERVFKSSGGTSGGSEPAWTITAGGTTSDNGITWTEVTGTAANNGDGGGSAWAAPHARLANASASGWMAAGDTCYFTSSHNETQSSNQSLTSPGTAASPCYYICTSATSLPPGAGTIATGGAVNPTASGGSSLTVGGYMYIYGLTFNVGTGSNSTTMTSGATGNAIIYDNCTFKQNNTSNSSSIILGGTSSGKDAYAKCKSCTFVYGAVGQAIAVQDGALDIVGGTLAGTGSVPTNPFRVGGPGKITVRDLDLSAVTSALISASTTIFNDFLVMNSKLNAGVTLTTGTITSLGGLTARAHNCGSSGTNYNINEAQFAGTLIQELTVVRTGGAFNGTTAYSWNVNTNGSASWAYPYSCPEIVKWNATTGSTVNVTVEVNSNVTLTNGDISLEVEYPSDASSPLCSTATSQKTDILQSNTNLTSSSATWGGSETSQQKMTVSVTPQQAGPIKARVKVMKPSIQVYVDPFITFS